MSIKSNNSSQFSKENTSFLNLIFIVFIVFSFFSFTLINKKSFNLFNSKNTKENKIEKSFTMQNNYQNLSFDKDLVQELHPISGSLGNVIEKLKKDFGFAEVDLQKMIALINNFKEVDLSILNAEACALIEQNRGLIEIKVKLDNFRYLKIFKDAEIKNNQDFDINQYKVKKIFHNESIQDLDTLTISQLNDINNDFVILAKDQNQSVIKKINQKYVFFETNIDNVAQIKRTLAKLNLNNDSISRIYTSYKDSEPNRLIKISGGNSGKNIYNKQPKIKFSALLINDVKSPELVYFAINQKGYYLYKKNNSKNFYDKNGYSLNKKSMFAFPLSGNYRVSSNFGMRMHPILHYTRMHTGVDLAIRHGHPVKASAAGVVEFAGYKGGYGNYIMINHGSGYKTAYAHLSGFAKNLRPGRIITSSQIIGYVGNTGTSSGPHLHYELIKNNRFINPLTNSPKVSERIEKNEMRNFINMVEQINIEVKNQKQNDYLQANSQIKI